MTDDVVVDPPRISHGAEHLLVALVHGVAGETPTEKELQDETCRRRGSYNIFLRELVEHDLADRRRDPDSAASGPGPYRYEPTERGEQLVREELDK